MKLLVSVRSADEALAALRGGADLIDVKEPSRGSLGQADDETIEHIAQALDGRAVMSAAMGELKDASTSEPIGYPLEYLKWGLAGCHRFPWRERLLELRDSNDATVVPTAYADAERAEAPAIAEVVDFVRKNGFPVLLIDTWGKDGQNLFSWIDELALRSLVVELHSGGVVVALAGSLSFQDIPMLQRVAPHWVAVRGAVCSGGQRTGTIDEQLVRSFETALTRLDEFRIR